MLVDDSLLPGDSVRAVESLAEAFDARSIRYALISGLAIVQGETGSGVKRGQG